MARGRTRRRSSSITIYSFTQKQNAARNHDPSENPGSGDPLHRNTARIKAVRRTVLQVRSSTSLARSRGRVARRAPAPPPEPDPTAAQPVERTATGRPVATARRATGREGQREAHWAHLQPLATPTPLSVGAPLSRSVWSAPAIQYRWWHSRYAPIKPMATKQHKDPKGKGRHEGRIRASHHTHACNTSFYSKLMRAHSHARPMALPFVASARTRPMA